MEIDDMAYDPDAPTKKVEWPLPKTTRQGSMILRSGKRLNLERLTGRSARAYAVPAKDLPSTSLINLLFFEKNISLAMWSSILTVAIILIGSLSTR